MKNNALGPSFDRQNNVVLQVLHQLHGSFVTADDREPERTCVHAVRNIIMTPCLQYKSKL